MLLHHVAGPSRQAPQRQFGPDTQLRLSQKRADESIGRWYRLMLSYQSGRREREDGQPSSVTLLAKATVIVRKNASNRIPLKAAIMRHKRLPRRRFETRNPFDCRQTGWRILEHGRLSIPTPSSLVLAAAGEPAKCSRNLHARILCDDQDSFFVRHQSQHDRKQTSFRS